MSFSNSECESKKIEYFQTNTVYIKTLVNINTFSKQLLDTADAN